MSRNDAMMHVLNGVSVFAVKRPVRCEGRGLGATYKNPRQKMPMSINFCGLRSSNRQTTGRGRTRIMTSVTMLPMEFIKNCI